MSKHTVHEDENSLYVKVGGYVARPVYPAGYSHVYDDGSSLEEGDKVYTNHTGGPLATVGDDKWYVHGPYMGPRSSNPENCWKPSHAHWGEDSGSEEDLPEAIRDNVMNVRNIDNEEN